MLSSLVLLLLLLTHTSFLALAEKSILAVNRCPHQLYVSYQTNGVPRSRVVHVDLGREERINVADDWAGRMWARKSCDGHDGCGGLAGAGNPASLAEFTMTGAYNVDYYDVSFVDGYNLPIRVEPVDAAPDGSSGLRRCQATFCSTVPACPPDLAVHDGGEFAGCQSACSRYKDDAYCCTGRHNTPETCRAGHFAHAVKAVCPDVYTYPYDDALSIYSCRASTYKVTFCP